MRASASTLPCDINAQGARQITFWGAPQITFWGARQITFWACGQCRGPKGTEVSAYAHNWLHIVLLTADPMPTLHMAHGAILSRSEKCGHLQSLQICQVRRTLLMKCCQGLARSLQALYSSGTRQGPRSARSLHPDALP